MRWILAAGLWTVSFANVVAAADSSMPYQQELVQIAQEVLLTSPITQVTLTLGLPYCWSSLSAVADGLLPLGPATTEYTMAHFESFDLSTSCYLHVSDGQGIVAATYTGTGRTDNGQDFWTVPVFDHTLCITLTCNNPLFEHSIPTLVVDRFLAGIPAHQQLAERRRRERDLAVCGTADFESAASYQDSSSDTERQMYQTSTAVGYLIIGGYICTGFLIDHHTMLTAKHCFTSNGSDYDPTAVNRLSATFLRERARTSTEETNSNTYAGDSVVAVSSNEDWVAFSLVPDSTKGDPGSRFGILEMEASFLPRDTQIFIPQHPQGRLKEISSKDTSEASGFCNINNLSGERYYYLCDTQGGSSGSPVIDFVTHKVIAVHTAAAGCSASWGNTGISTSSFASELLLPTSPPSAPPTTIPTGARPTQAPVTNFPTRLPTQRPVANAPTPRPTKPKKNNRPTDRPTRDPTFTPTKLLSSKPTRFPTNEPSLGPTHGPTSLPSARPTELPSGNPSPNPTTRPTSRPTLRPTIEHSNEPTPTSLPTSRPTEEPTSSPSSSPTTRPTSIPTLRPTIEHSYEPTATPSSAPTTRPTSLPSARPTEHPSGNPSPSPTARPTNKPTMHPTLDASNEPTATPSSEPTTTPTSLPTSRPTREPSSSPSSSPPAKPTRRPTLRPTFDPSNEPTPSPSAFPTTMPTRFPTKVPTAWPTQVPSIAPSQDPTHRPTRVPTVQPSQQPETKYPPARPTQSCKDDPEWRGLLGITCSSIGACLVSGNACPESCGQCA